MGSPALMSIGLRGRQLSDTNENATAHEDDHHRSEAYQLFKMPEAMTRNSHHALPGTATKSDD